jgi:hypothetical protein
MRKDLWSLVAFLILVAGIFYVANYSADTAVYECTGMMAKASDNYPTPLFIKVTQHRWWAFWASPLDGWLQWEVQIPGDDPAKAIKTDFFQIKRVGQSGSYLSLYRYKAGETVDLTKPSQGVFSHHKQFSNAQNK